MQAGGTRRAIGAAMTGMAGFRVVLGAASWLAPAQVTRIYGVADKRMTPELEYMTRVFGVRAVALGLGYLTSSGDARRVWQRLWLLADAADTAMGLDMVRRGRLDAKLGTSALATTAPAMALDIAALAAREA
jgi:hypothetical protein